MKKIFISALALLLTGTIMAQNVGINTNSPDNSAALHVDATNKGLLIPRMNKNTRGTITSPANGLLIYQTDDTPGFYYNSGTSASPVWTPVAGSSSAGSSGASIYGNGTTALTVSAGTTLDWTTTPPANLDLQFSSISIAASGTLIVPSGTKIRCSGNVAVAGTISVVSSPKTNSVNNGDRGIAQSVAVYGSPSYTPMGLKPAMVSSLINIPLFGGGSGAGGLSGETYGGGGGGSFAIYANGTINVSGSIKANGANAENVVSTVNIAGSGGGGGGLIVLLAKGAITVGGSLQANGGNGSQGYIATTSSTYRSGGAGGGGGIVCLVSTVTPTLTGSIQVNGGTAGTTANGTGSSVQSGGNGGASGGNGGVSSTTIGVSATVGATGFSRTITVPNPENLY